MNRYGYLAVFALLCAAVRASGPEETDSDSARWNRGVDFYRGGDYTNALEVLKSIIHSRTHGARAAEVVAKIEYDIARRPGEKSAYMHLVESADAAQKALRANPDDKRLRDNFARAAADIPSLRETKRIDAVLEKYKDRDPASLADEAWRLARETALESLSYSTNPPVQAVAAADRLSAKMDRIRDLSLVLKGAADPGGGQDGGNGQNAQAAEFLDRLVSKAGEASTALADVSSEARFPAAEVEDALNTVRKWTVMPPEAIRIDQVCQSNAWLDAEEEFSRPWQGEACDFTAAFAAKFPMWADEYISKAASNTNMPPFTAETKEKILSLAEELRQTQELCRKEALPPKQEDALDLIRQIVELMPEDNNGGGGDDQNKNDQKNDSGGKDSQQQGKDAGSDGGEAKDGPENKEGDGRDEDEKDDTPGQAGEEEMSGDEKMIEAILKQAQERSDEHERQKNMARPRLPANERDW